MNIALMASQRVFGRTPGTKDKTFANSFSYTAAGGVSQLKLGNGRFESAVFNSRLQLTQLGLGASVAAPGDWKVNYDYGELDSNGTLDPAKNTGNIARQTLFFNALNAPMVQSYRYDPLYRLTEAKETSNSTQNWIQNWTYDPYGNRQTFTQNIGGITTAPNPGVNVNTNRFNTGQGFNYDKNGNVTNDVDPVTTHPGSSSSMAIISRYM